MKKKLEQCKIYLLLAKESEATDPIVAHACRTFYVDRFMETKKKLGEALTPEEKKDLSELLSIIEAAKKEAGLNKETTREAVENFCGLRFAVLDKEEHKTAKITKKHAMLFKNMANYIELLAMYGPLPPKWDEKLKYCKLKAVNIVRCLNQGIDPPRGNPEHPDPAPSPEEIAANVSPAGNNEIQNVSSPYNAKGKIVKGNSKYDEVMGSIQRCMEGALSDINKDNVNSARESLTKALSQLKLLE
eukprot:TRINITY_DN4293_c0_g1_i20.p1 TRINITY_DN4293_c0_g1~~TRINITY_DN4293_c0_g1_i20.p1  ORF type:complete len:245 (-),score=96.84 TRINITY_DN4293_c0_g1_i20:106-840(-)